jgi:DNA-binding HxlR family transcriptional regulator
VTGPSSRLVDLAHHRWSIPILADLEPRGGARIVELAHRVGGSREAVRQAADMLVRMGLLAPNPGHGHPLRPEVMLSEAGRRAAGSAVALERALARADATDLARRKWTLPVLLSLRSGAARYGEVRRTLPRVTDRALSSALQELEQTGLVARDVVDGAPPFARYRITAAAQPVVTAAHELLAAVRKG